MIRAIAIEALEADPTVLEPAVRRGLGDPNPGVRFCAAVVGSKARLPGLAPLVEPLLLDPSPSVQAGAILALHRCGRTVDPTPLGSMVVSPSPEIRGNAVMVLGDLGNRSAVPLLKAGYETPMPRAMPAAVRVVDLQIAEAMVKLGDLSQLEPVHAALFSRSDQGECIALACQIVGTLRDKSALPMLQRLIDAGGDDTRPLEIRLVAAIACMKILNPGPEALGELGLQGARDSRPEVRALSARLLGWFSTPQSAAALSQLLRDKDPSVQISAAASVLGLQAASRASEAAQR
jgi:HEAT repeat protein